MLRDTHESIVDDWMANAQAQDGPSFGILSRVQIVILAAGRPKEIMLAFPSAIAIFAVSFV